MALAGPSGAGKTTRAAHRGGAAAPGRGPRALRRTDVARHRRRASTLAPERRGVRLRVPGLRAVPQPQRLAQRRLRHATAPRARAPARGRASCSTASAWRASRDARARARSRAASASGSRWPGRSRREPRALLLDEPLSALDARTRASARRELARCCAAAEVPVLLVTPRLRGGGAARRPGRDRWTAAACSSAAPPPSSPASPELGLRRRADRGRGAERHGPRGGRADRGRPRRRRRVTSTDRASGPVAVTVHPWEVSLEPAAGARRHPRGTGCRSPWRRSRLGNRVRVGLDGPQPLVADLTEAGRRRLA